MFFENLLRLLHLVPVKKFQEKQCETINLDVCFIQITIP